MGVGHVHYICDDCWEQIELISKPYCETCGRAMDPKAAHRGNHKCWWCRRQPPSFSKARSIAHYEPTFKDAIHLFKYKNKTVMARHFGELMQTTVPALFEISDYDYLMPVPLHKKRYRERGFNQAELLAHQLKQIFEIPMHTGNLIRVKHTQPQFSLESREEKLQNVQNAFKVRYPGKIEGRTLLLIDDIFTTGATVSEIARTLLDAGACRVDVLTLARAGWSAQQPESEEVSNNYALSD